MRPVFVAILCGLLGAAVYCLAQGPEAGYVAPATCQACHAKIWQTYQLTGMGRSFYRPTVQMGAAARPFYHAASDSYFSMVTRDGKLFQRRHQLGAGGAAVNVLEKLVDYVMGSGNHARAFLHRTAAGTLVELPLAWYAEKGGSWDMNPGYDTAEHEGFRRKITYDCMFCHNGYPKIPAGHEKTYAEPVYLEPLPMGIDCQRCHGPGGAHVRAAQGGLGVAAIRKAIVNPARLSAERREEVCIQCHLETTSFPLPNSLARYGKGPFDYKAGEKLSEAWLFFDHPAEAGRGDKFEIVNAVYRIRKSKCYLESKGAMGCTTCHNPHDVPRGAAATTAYDAACRKCHGEGFARVVAAGKHTTAGGCAECHMPKRRTEDVVHSLATDHLIQRRKPAGDLLAEFPERHETGAMAYRGEVVPYYPEKGVEELYVALAQVIQKSNLGAGTERLAKAIQPGAPVEFTVELAEARGHRGEWAKAIPLYREAVRREPGSVALRRKLGAALRKAGQLEEAVAVLRRAGAWQELGLALQAQGKLGAARAALEKAVAEDPDAAEARSHLGIVLAQGGETRGAEAAFREAIRLQPELVEARNNLGNLLSAAGDLAGARVQFTAAARTRPADATTHYNYAMALGRGRLFVEAQRELETAVRADAGHVEARGRLAELLMAKGDARGAVVHYRELVRLRPEGGAGVLGLGAALAMSGDVAGGLPYLKKAAGSKEAGVREQALEILRQVEGRR